jgi:hypothetical protein
VAGGRTNGDGHRNHGASVTSSHRDQHEPRPQLRDAEIGRVQQSPARDVSEVAQPVQDVLPVRAEPAGAQPSDVLQQQGSRLDDPAQLHRPGEQVPLVGGAELPPRHGERRAGHPAGQQRHVPVILRPPQVPVGHIPLGDLPRGPVGAQRGAGRPVELHGQGVLEAGSFQPESLPARPSADPDDIKNGESRHLGLLSSSRRSIFPQPGHLVMERDQRSDVA